MVKTPAHARRSPQSAHRNVSVQSGNLGAGLAATPFLRHLAGMTASTHRQEEARGGKAGEEARGLLLAGQRLAVPRAAPGLHVVATPIGNLEDITLRALKALAGADAILAEDTRQTAKLLSRYGIRRPLMAFHEHNEEAVQEQVLARLRDGAALALVSDAGTPLVSDPGVKLLRAATGAALPVHAEPGPSAALAALVLSGLTTERFLFAGFPPAKQQARRRFLQALKDIPATLVLYESPHRIKASLRDMAEVLGARRAALCRELTKLHEEVIRAPLPELVQQLEERERIRGEITLVIAPPRKQAPAAADDEAVEQALRAALQEMPASRAAAEVARRFGLRKRDLYEKAVQLSRG